MAVQPDVAVYLDPRVKLPRGQDKPIHWFLSDLFGNPKNRFSLKEARVLSDHFLAAISQQVPSFVIATPHYVNVSVLIKFSQKYNIIEVFLP